ncbi:Uncharacterized conserved protein, contains FIST_N domain [Saccharicrinis carchari]|uniref:Uncharacterized conserved protein, contains FIST_N domain n=1 Tax=Saccharicrinis carchari TaxID=1168039 RepID=A0A521BCT5_SACCC|nr:FIST N-terminal domain-containing protein [Saccharicrinis carchari]SMO44560.1 Uncharacterized conserved protein, contains FIST_N domain [Saccharicrinis carchari]
MKVKIAHSTKQDIDGILKDIKMQIGDCDPKFIQFYASPTINPEKISRGVYEMFEQTPVIGCSSSGEIVSGKMLENSIVLMALGEEIVEDCKIEVLTDITEDILAVDKSFVRLKDYYGEDLSQLDTKEHVGLLLIDGLSGMEEKINERIGDLTNITFVGGSAGDNMAFKKTYVYANGEYYSNAAVIALLKCNTAFSVLKTQSFKSLNKKALITKSEARRVMEINGKPASTEYARLMGTNDELVENQFFTHPLGISVVGDYFVRSPQRVDGNDVLFYCGINEGVELELLESQDIIESTKQDLAEKVQELGSVSALINFNCMFRTLELQDKNQTNAYGKLFADIPTVGLSTYGESYIGHMNQTATILLFK